MMIFPGLSAIDCPNRDICGTIVHLSEEERIELHRARSEHSHIMLWGNTRSGKSLLFNIYDAIVDISNEEQTELHRNR
jgi:50S ribosomal subunit-associated GTPase HflX